MMSFPVVPSREAPPVYTSGDKSGEMGDPALPGSMRLDQ